MSLYLSYIQEERDELERKLEVLEQLTETIEGKCDDIIEELRDMMRERIYDAVSEAFAEAGIEDNYYNEKEQETVDAMVEKIQQEF